MKILIEAIEPMLPVLPVLSYPTRGLLERLSLEQTRPSLRVAAAYDESGALEYLQVLRDRRQAHFKRRRELPDRCRAARDPRKNRPPGWIGERRECRAESVACHYETNWLFN